MNQELNNNELVQPYDPSHLNRLREDDNFFLIFHQIYIFFK